MLDRTGHGRHQVLPNRESPPHGDPWSFFFSSANSFYSRLTNGELAVVPLLARRPDQSFHLVGFPRVQWTWHSDSLPVLSDPQRHSDLLSLDDRASAVHGTHVLRAVGIRVEPEDGVSGLRCEDQTDVREKGSCNLKNFKLKFITLKENAIIH